MNVEDKVIAIIEEQLGFPKVKVLLTSTKESLGMDSLDEIETLMALEEEFDMEINDHQAEKFNTVQDVVDFIKVNQVYNQMSKESYNAAKEVFREEYNGKTIHGVVDNNKYPLSYTYKQLEGKDLVAHKNGYMDEDKRLFCKKDNIYKIVFMTEEELSFTDEAGDNHNWDLYDVGEYFYPVDKVESDLYNPVKNISREKYRRCVKRLSTKLFRSNINGSCLWMHLSKCGKYYYWCEYNSKNSVIYFRGEVDWVESNYDKYDQVSKEGVIVSFDSDGVVGDCKTTCTDNSTQLKEEAMKDSTQPKTEWIDKPSPIKSDGGKSDYYKIVLPEWVLKKHSEKGFIMLEDLAEAMFKNDFNFTNVFKAQKRMFELREGGGKEGNDFNYDATKCKYYIDKQVEVESRK